MDGLFALSLSPKKSSDDGNNLFGSFSRQKERALYFHTLASGYENFVPLRLINNYTIWESDANSEPRAFKVLGSRGIQTAGDWVSNVNCEKKCIPIHPIKKQLKQWTEMEICFSCCWIQLRWHVGTHRCRTPSKTSKSCCRTTQHCSSRVVWRSSKICSATKSFGFLQIVFRYEKWNHCIRILAWWIIIYFFFSTNILQWFNKSLEKTKIVLLFQLSLSALFTCIIEVHIAFFIYFSQTENKCRHVESQRGKFPHSTQTHQRAFERQNKVQRAAAEWKFSLPKHLSFKAVTWYSQ